MKRIKVTGYIDPDDLDFDQKDPTHGMGITNAFYEAAMQSPESTVGPLLQELEFELVDE